MPARVRRSQWMMRHLVYLLGCIERLWLVHMVSSVIWLPSPYVHLYVLNIFWFWNAWNYKSTLRQYSFFKPWASKAKSHKTIHLHYQFIILYNNSQSSMHGDRWWLQSCHTRQVWRLTKLSSQNGSKTGFGHQIRSDDTSALLVTESNSLKDATGKSAFLLLCCYLEWPI